jgi:hypothetical protein
VLLLKGVEEVEGTGEGGMRREIPRFKKKIKWQPPENRPPSITRVAVCVYQKVASTELTKQQVRQFRIPINERRHYNTLPRYYIPHDSVPITLARIKQSNCSVLPPVIYTHNIRIINAVIECQELNRKVMYPEVPPELTNYSYLIENWNLSDAIFEKYHTCDTYNFYNQSEKW